MIERNDMTKEVKTPAPEKTEAKRLTVTIDFTDYKVIYDWLVVEAMADERTPSVWLRRMISDQYAKLTSKNGIDNELPDF